MIPNGPRTKLPLAAAPPGGERHVTLSWFSFRNLWKTLLTIHQSYENSAQSKGLFAADISWPHRLSYVAESSNHFPTRFSSESSNICEISGSVIRADIAISQHIRCLCRFYPPGSSPAAPAIFFPDSPRNQGFSPPPPARSRCRRRASIKRFESQSKRPVRRKVQPAPTANETQNNAGRPEAGGPCGLEPKRTIHTGFSCRRLVAGSRLP